MIIQRFSSFSFMAFCETQILHCMELMFFIAFNETHVLSKFYSIFLHAYMFFLNLMLSISPDRQHFSVLTSVADVKEIFNSFTSCSWVYSNYFSVNSGL